MVVMQQKRVARRSPTDCRISTLPVAAPSALSIFVTIGLLLLYFIRVFKVIGLGFLDFRRSGSLHILLRCVNTKRISTVVTPLTHIWRCVVRYLWLRCVGFRKRNSAVVDH